MKKNFRFLGVLLVVALMFTMVLGTGLVAFAGPISETLVSGHYYVPEDAYASNAGGMGGMGGMGSMTFALYFVIDAEADTFNLYASTDGKPDMSETGNKGSGTISYDSSTGVYTLTRSDDATKTTTMTATADKLTFTSKVYYGTSSMNNEVNGVFVPYSADKIVEDMLMSGNYLITSEAYGSPIMELNTYIVIDRDRDTFDLYSYADGKAEMSESKGSGSIAYDMKTGVYTLAYDAGVGGAGAGVKSTATATKDSLTYTTPIYVGGTQMNVLDSNNNFATYTAKLVTDSSAANVDVNTGSTIEGTVAKSTVADNTIENATKAAINAAQTSGAAPKVALSIETDADADTLEVTLRTIELAALTAVDGAMFEIASDIGSITFDKAAIEKLAMYSDVPVTFSVGEAKSLTDEQKATAGDDTVFTLTAMAGTEYITNFDGSVTVTVPYTLKDGENADDITVYHLDSEGKLTKLSATYANGMVTFTTTHFSEFLIRAVSTDADVDADADSDIPDTSSSDNTINIVLISLIGLSVLGSSVVLIKRKKDSTDAR